MRDAHPPGRDRNAQRIAPDQRQDARRRQERRGDEPEPRQDRDCRREHDRDHQRRRADQADAQLRTVNVTALDKQTRFINTQLAERAFSWSELLDKLERVIPENVRITTISPTFDETSGYVHLEIACEDKTGGGMVEMINRMMTATQFHNPFPRVETRMGVDPKSGYQFSLSVDFKPALSRVVAK